MKCITIFAGGLAIAIGLGATTVDVWSNVEFIAGDTVRNPADLADVTNWNSLMAATVAIAVASFGALGGAAAAWRLQARLISCGLLFAWICAAAFSLSATLDRAGSQRDNAIHAQRSHNVQIDRVAAAITTQRARLKAATQAEADECKGYKAGVSKDEGWPKCITAKGEIKSATNEIGELEAKLAGLGAEKVEDSMGSRVAALFPFLTPGQVATYQPITLPVSLFFFGQFFPALGFLLWSSVLTVPAPQSQQTAQVMRDITPVHPVIAALPAGKAISNKALAAALGYSEATASRHVKQLRREGLLTVERRGRELAIRRLS
ncbi:winged helix-turn-helix transcriptional regulator [Filomicrobium sp.]|uniref:helix-turn-helix domain-containing protein n=1 Tax=Filomicrobium sp. TaxID=2024831 RepID=UPI0025907489|nr:winged helix-turn-helix transcriptional regulator [Filomicrobium sp.]MCV0371091.1 helix-turn-helix domain-containing protein [Filomicrobium sp.]